MVLDEYRGDMTLDEYQGLAMRTAAVQKPLVLDPVRAGLLNALMGMAGESGEAIDLMKKVLFHGHPWTDEIEQKLDKEVGDVLWYASQYAKYSGTSLGRVAQKNLAKLAQRYGSEFSTEGSMNRTEYREVPDGFGGTVTVAP
jgi:NTP pyrophosphatase (non-canonical NTP hydrolase)